MYLTTFAEGEKRRRRSKEEGSRGRQKESGKISSALMYVRADGRS